MEALVRRLCAEAGFEPHVRHQTNELSMLLALVAGGHAVTMLPEIAFAGGHEGVAVRPIRGVEVDRTVFTAARTGADRRPALAAVRDAVRTATAGLPSSRSGPSGSS
jgi:DNA-binding transcriptional LysR family regulator